MNHVYLSDQHGCAYRLDEEGYLIYTPLHEDLTYDTCIDNWCCVDFMELRDHGEEVVAHAEWVASHLRVLDEGIFADPMRMEDTPLAEMYGG